MRSLQIQKVFDVAEKHKSNPILFNRSVLIVTDDGSQFCYENSYVQKYENEDGEWYIVFPEHFDINVFHVDDILLISQFSNKIPISNFLLEGDG